MKEQKVKKIVNVVLRTKVSMKAMNMMPIPMTMPLYFQKEMKMNKKKEKKEKKILQVVPKTKESMKERSMTPILMLIPMPMPEHQYNK